MQTEKTNQKQIIYESEITSNKVNKIKSCECFCVQAEEWVSERMQKMAEDGKADLSNLQTKMKLLQKHQVFEAEILAHSEIISSVLQVRRGGEGEREEKRGGGERRTRRGRRK